MTYDLRQGAPAYTSPTMQYANGPTDRSNMSTQMSMSTACAHFAPDDVRAGIVRIPRSTRLQIVRW
jgi:hypothetical protein